MHNDPASKKLKDFGRKSYEQHKNLGPDSNFASVIENIALLAETALRFLELVQLKTLNMENEPDSEEVDEATRPNGDYDTGCVINPLKTPSIYTESLMVTCKSSHL